MGISPNNDIEKEDNIIQIELIGVFSIKKKKKKPQKLWEEATDEIIEQLITPKRKSWRNFFNFKTRL